MILIFLWASLQPPVQFWADFLMNNSEDLFYA